MGRMLRAVGRTVATAAVTLAAATGSLAATGPGTAGAAGPTTTMPPTATAPTLGPSAHALEAGPVARQGPVADRAPLPHASPGGWSLQAAASPGDGAQLYDVSCSSTAFCMAVGFVLDNGYDQTLVEEWNGTAWTVAPSPDVSSSTANFLLGVSCPTATFCAAVGYESPGGSAPDVPLAELYEGGAWTMATAPDPATSENDQLYRVSCTGATFCMAVGSSYSEVAEQTLAATWDGEAWTASLAAEPAGDPLDFFESVTCKTPSWCVAVGGADADGVGTTLVERWDAGSWSVAPSPDPIGDTEAELNSVSCSGTTFCVAVGSGSTGGTDQERTLTEVWTGGGWTLTASPDATDFDNELWAVSCTGPTRCAAVGWADADSSASSTVTYVTAGLAWDGTGWTLDPPADPAVTTGQDFAELSGVDCLAGAECVAVGDAYPGDNSEHETLVETAPIPRPGYRLVASDGGIFAFGGAGFDGSTGGLTLDRPVVGMAPTPDGGGYWLVASDGGVFAFGDAHFYGSTGGLPLDAPIVGMAPTPDGGGYWLVASDGGIFAFGDAPFEGSTGGFPLVRPVVGMAPTPDGGGYWLVASDGGIFAFGDAPFEGSTGGLPLNRPVVGMAPTPSGRGYWLVASDGGIFAFGDARFFGSAGGLTLDRPVVGMAATPDGGGYWLVASDGGIFAVGDAPFRGSTGALTLDRPVVGMGA